MTTQIDAILQRAPVIPVLVIGDVRHAVPLARALVAGGLPILEITLRTPSATAAITAIKQEVPDAIVGAGTVLDGRLLEKACEADADFIVTPGCTADLLFRLQQCGRPFLPGVSTPSEMMTLLEHDITSMKLFPAEACGGVALLKAVAGPLPQIRFCPTGGIGPHNAEAYLALPNVACIGGSWLAPSDLVAQEHWSSVQELAAATRTLKTCP